jgi:glutamate-ammonia-ligase adenylyltransferase
VTVQQQRPAPAGGVARLARLGFAQPERAARLLGPTGLRLWDETPARPTGPDAAAVVSALGRAADPDLALLALARLAEALGAGSAALLDRLRSSGALRARLISLLGASSALGDHLVAHPTDWRLLDPDRGAPPAAAPADHPPAGPADPASPAGRSGVGPARPPRRPAVDGGRDHGRQRPAALGGRAASPGRRAGLRPGRACRRAAGRGRSRSGRSAHRDRWERRPGCR